MAEYSALFARIDLALSQHSQSSEHEPDSPTASEQGEQQGRQEEARVERSVDIVRSARPHTEQRARTSSKRARLVEQPSVVWEEVSQTVSAHARNERSSDSAEAWMHVARAADDADDEMDELKRCGLLS